MKIKLANLRRMITEIASDSDIFVYPAEPEYGGEKLGKDCIDDTCDLSTVTHNDISSDVGDGPAACEEGTWIWCITTTEV